jgi:hypothetical protein
MVKATNAQILYFDSLIRALVTLSSFVVQNALAAHLFR